MRSKLIKVLVCFLIIACLFPSSVSATNISNLEVIKIGYLPNYATINNLDSYEYKGYGYEFFEEISNYTGHFYEFVPCTLEDGMVMLENGEIDLLGPLEKSGDMENKLAYPNLDFGVENIILCAPFDADIYFKDFSAFHNKKVATIDQFYKPLLENYLSEQSVKVDFVDINEIDILTGLNDGRFDLVLASSMYKLPNMNIVAKVATYPIYYAASNKNKELIEKIDMALKEIYRKDLMFSPNLYYKYFTGSNYAKKTLSREQLQKIQQHGIFKVGISKNIQPLQYEDKDGKPAGICIDIMDKLAEQFEIDVEYVFLDREDKDIDIDLRFLNSLVNIDQYNISNPYMEQSLVSIKSKKLPIKSSYVIGMPDYILLDEKDFENEALVARVEVIDILEKRIDMLKKGEVDYIFATDFISDQILAEVGSDDYSVYPSPINISFRMLISKKLPDDFVDIFNVIISHLDKKEITASITKNMRIMQEDKSLQDRIYENRHFIMISIATILAIYVMLIRSKHKALKKSVEIDELTGLYTERKFLQEGKKLLLTAKPGEYMLISYDINKFQYINDIYGYERGSLFLKEFANRLKNCFTDNDIIARIHADNFLVIAKAKKQNSFCGKKECENCLINYPSMLLNDNYKINVSRGIYVISNVELDINNMIDCANSARLISKHTFSKDGSPIIIFSKKMEQSRESAKKIVASMEQALLNNEFKIAYQPKINLKTREIVGAESLVRWITSEKITLYPDEFIPIFEQNGFISKLDFYVLEEVCKFINAQKKLYLSIPKIAINISGVTLQDRDFILTFTTILKQYKIDYREIEIEITESVIIDNFELTSMKIEKLRSYGVSIAMDDFGSGFSSIGRLTEIAIDVLKIDKSILSHFLDKRQDVAIIKNTLSLGRRLKLVTVAEGVETKEQADWLEKDGCEIAQGYYFAKPMFEKEFLEFIFTWKVKEL